MQYLVYLSGPHKGARVRVDRPRVTIGRERSNDVPLEDENASRRHAELVLREGSHYVRDLHSTNGTFVNGTLASDEVKVSSGDTIVIGDSSLLYQETEGSRVSHSVAFKEDSPAEDSRQFVLDPTKSKYLDPRALAARPEAAEQLARLSRFVSCITPILSTERLGNVTLDFVLEAIRADRAFIMLLDENQRLQPVAIRLRDASSSPSEVQVSRRVTEKVLSTGESILSMDTATDNRFKDSVAITRSRVNSFICAPLRSGDRILGLLYADTSGMNAQLTEDDLQLLTAMSLMVGAQFGNARLYGELLNAHEYTQSILRCLRSGVIVTEHDCIVKQVNAASCDLLRLREDELVGRKLQDFPNLRVLWRVIDETMRSGIPSERQEVVLEVGGDNVPVGITTSLLRDFENRVRGVVTNFRSLSVIKKLSEQVKMAQHLAALGEMAAGIAHEIRNPLNSIRGFTQLLEGYVATGDTEKDAAAKNYVKIVIDEVDRMNRLVQDLLDFSRQRELTMGRMDVVKVVDEVLVEMGPDLTGAAVKLQTEYASGLAPVMANVNKLKQVLMNIVRNAVQAMTPPDAPEGQPRNLTVSVRAVSEAEGLSAIQIAVADSGTGMPAEAVARVFEPFFTTRERGTGLGLAICRKIIEQHGGTISFDTRLDAGTTMKVSLPTT
jgi:two-component system nitrogen regulation sensor histidine kinase GlnL